MNLLALLNAITFSPSLRILKNHKNESFVNQPINKSLVVYFIIQAPHNKQRQWTATVKLDLKAHIKTQSPLATISNHCLNASLKVSGRELIFRIMT